MAGSTFPYPCLDPKCLMRFASVYVEIVTKLVF